MAWTLAQDVIDSWIGDDAPADPLLVDAWIGRAERVLRRKVPDLQSRIDLGEADLLETVQDVVSAMVARVFRNPDGVRQRQETTGPFTGSVTYGGDQPGALVVLPDELAALTGGAVGKGKAGGVDMIPPGSPFHGDYAPNYVPGVWS